VQHGNRGDIHSGRRRVVLGVPLGSGATHVVALRPIGVDEAPQHPPKFGKIRGQARSPGLEQPLLKGGSHDGSHFDSTNPGALCSGEIAR
jgi:hypothetical protein